MVNQCTHLVPQLRWLRLLLCTCCHGLSGSIWSWISHGLSPLSVVFSQTSCYFHHWWYRKAIGLWQNANILLCTRNHGAHHVQVPSMIRTSPVSATHKMHPGHVCNPFVLFCSIIALVSTFHGAKSRHWAWLRRGYWCYRSLIDWLIEIVHEGSSLVEMFIKETNMGVITCIIYPFYRYKEQRWNVSSKYLPCYLYWQYRYSKFDFKVVLKVGGGDFRGSIAVFKGGILCRTDQYFKHKFAGTLKSSRNTLPTELFVN